MSFGARASSYAPTGGGFVPSDLANLALWLDADDASTFTYSSGSVVSQWNDKSGNGLHAAQATTAWQPSRSGTMNGRSTVVFDGSADRMVGTVPSSQTDNWTLFVVCDETGGGTQRVPCSIGDPNADGFGLATRTMGGSGLGWIRVGIAWETSTTAPPSGAMTLTLQRAAGTTTLYLDGAAVSPTWGGAPAAPSTYYQLSAANYLFGGDIAEVIYYTAALSGTDRQSVESYLSAKWGTP